MAERNAIKTRTCRVCGAVLTGKASILKQHGRERGHRKVMLDAAQEALMEKIKAELARPVTGVDLAKLGYEAANDKLREAMDKRFIQMADARVTEAEGD